MTVSIGFIFEDDHTQTVQLPTEARFPKSVKKVTVRVVGKDRIISPVENTWDGFFLGGETATEDFMSERPDQSESSRESF